MTTYTDKDITDLKAYVSDHIVAINIVDLIEHYDGRIRELEQQLRDARLQNANALFQDQDDS